MLGRRLKRQDGQKQPTHRSSPHLCQTYIHQVGLGAVQDADDDILSLSHRAPAAGRSSSGHQQEQAHERGGKGRGKGSSDKGTSILPSSKKVQLLQHRLSSRSGGPNQRASLGASSKRLTAHRTGGGGGGGGVAAAAAAPSRAGGGAVPAGATEALPSPEIYFPGNQEFFYHFLRACDSYALNLALARVLGAELARTVALPHRAGSSRSGGASSSSSKAEGRSQESSSSTTSHSSSSRRRPSEAAAAEEDGDTEGGGHGAGGQLLTDPMHLARLKLLARFLGLLVFGPNWTSALPQLLLLE